MLDTSGRLKDRQWDDEVRRQNDVLVEVNGKAMRRELLAKNVKGAGNILRPLMNDVVVSVRLNEAARGSA